MLLTFTNVGGSTFPQATQAVLDMATAMNGGAIPSEEQLRNETILLGKALNDPIKGLTSLQHVGVTFSESQRESIKAMMEVNNIAGAQAIILQELAKEFGGSAQAAGGSFAGQMAIAKNEVKNLKEEVGAFLILLNQQTGALAFATTVVKGWRLMLSGEGIAPVDATLAATMQQWMMASEQLRLAQVRLTEAQATQNPYIIEAAQNGLALADANMSAAEAAYQAAEAGKAEAGAVQGVGAAAGDAAGGIDDFNAANKSLVRAGGMIADTLERQKDQLAALLALREREKFLGRAMPTGPNLDWMGVIQNMPQPRFDDAPTEEEQAASHRTRHGGPGDGSPPMGSDSIPASASDYSQKMQAAVNLVSAAISARRWMMSKSSWAMRWARRAVVWGLGRMAHLRTSFGPPMWRSMAPSLPGLRNLGLTQEAAMQIVRDFTSGAMTGAVQALINVPALIQAAQTAQMATSLKEQVRRRHCGGSRRRHVNRRSPFRRGGRRQRRLYRRWR